MHSSSKCFPTKTLYAPILYSPLPCYMPSLAHSSCFDLRNYIWWHCRSLSPLSNFLHSPVTLSLLDPNILVSTLFPNTLSLRFARNVNDQLSHPYNTTGRIIVLCNLTFAFRIANRRQSILRGMIASISWLQAVLNFFTNVILICQGCSQILELQQPFKSLLPIFTFSFYPAFWSRDMTMY